MGDTTVAVSAGSVLLDILPNVAGLSTKMRESAALAAKEASSGAVITPKVDGAASGKRFGSGFLAEAKKVAVAAGALFAAKAVVDFGKESIAAFTGTAKAALLLNRSIGGTVEDSSRLIFAANESGVSTDSLGRSMKLLERNVVSVGGKTPAGAAALKQLGVEANDSHGKLLPMAQLLPDIAEKFKAMPGGAEKSALALKLFGKGGLEMLPFLNKGKEGIAELTAESDKYGHTISGPQAAAVKANIVAQRQFNAAIEGVKIQLGAQLLPVLTSVTAAFRTQVLPAVLAVTTFLKEHANTVTTVAKVLVPLVLGLAVFVGVIEKAKAVVGAFTTLQAALNVVMAANPIGLVVIALVALVAALVFAYTHSTTFRNIVNAAWASIAAAVKAAWEGVIRPAIQAMVAFWQNVLAPAVMFLYNGVIKPVWAGISAYIGAAIGVVRGVISAVLNAIHGNWSGVWNDIKGILSSVWGGITGVVSAGLAVVSNLFGGLGGRILGALGNLGGLLLQAGRDVISGLINGITGSAGAVGSAISNVVGGAVNAAKSALGIKSPSLVFHQLGVFSGQGLALGLTSMQDHVARAGTALAGSAVPAAPAFVGTAGTAAGRAGGVGTTGPLVAVYPRAGQSEEEIATIAASKLMFHLVSA